MHVVQCKPMFLNLFPLSFSSGQQSPQYYPGMFFPHSAACFSFYFPWAFFHIGFDQGIYFKLQALGVNRSPRWEDTWSTHSFNTSSTKVIDAIPKFNLILLEWVNNSHYHSHHWQSRSAWPPSHSHPAAAAAASTAAAATVKPVRWVLRRHYYHITKKRAKN